MSPHLRASGWMLLGVGSFVLMGLLAKSLGQRLHPLEVAFARALFGLATVLPLALREGLGLWRTPHWRLHLARGLLGTIAMASAFYAVARLPLAEATAYGYTRPLFLVWLAALLLRERPGPMRLLATVVGFLGVLLMLRPTAAGIQPGAAVALLGAACAAGVGVLLRRIAQRDRPAVMLAWLGTLSTLLLAGPALWVWRTPTPAELGLMGLMGLAGTLTQLAFLRAYRLAEASALAPLDYLRLPLAALAGWLIFGEWPHATAWGGAAVVVAANLALLLREHAAGGERLPAEPCGNPPPWRSPRAR